MQAFLHGLDKKSDTGSIMYGFLGAGYSDKAKMQFEQIHFSFPGDRVESISTQYHVTAIVFCI